MKIKQIALYLLLAFTLTAFAAQAQNAKPIKWRMTVKMTSADTGTVTLRAIVDNGWHLYGTELPANGPVPTTMDFSESKVVKFTGPAVPSAKPASHKDEMFGMTLSWWDANVTFTRHFRLEGDITDAVIKAKVKYMGCNDQNCLPPATETLTVKPKPFVAK